MLESYLVVPLHFTIEFFGFLVMAGACVLLTVGPPLLPAGGHRAVAATGFGVLAAAQFIHGASFVEPDGAEVLAIAKAAGLLLVFAGLGESSPATASAGTTSLARGVALAPAVAAIALSIRAFRARVRGRAGLLWLAVGALALAVSEGATAIHPRTQLELAGEQPFAYVAHGAKAIAFVFIGVWLWDAVRRSIRARFVASFAVLLLVVVLVLSTALTGVISTNAADQELARIKNQVKGALQGIEGTESEQLRDDINTLVRLPFVRDSLSNPKRKSVNKLARKIHGSGLFNVYFAVVMNAHGGLLAYAGDGPAVIKDRRGASYTRLNRTELLAIAGSSAVRAATGRVPVAVAPDRVGRSVAVVAAGEVTREAGRGRLGIVAAGRFVDALAMERISRDFRPAEATLVVADRIAATELPRQTDSAELIPPSVRDQARTGKVPSEEVDINGHLYFSAFGALRDQAGPIGATLVLSSPASVIGETRTGVTRTLFLVALGAGVIVVVLAWAFGLRITRPIQSLTTAARSVREGDLSTRSGVSGSDEVGELGQTFDEMTAELLRTTTDLQGAARLEQRLRARMEAIVQSMADGLIAINADRSVVAFNPQAERLTGMISTSAIGKQVDDVLDTRDAEGERLRTPVHDLEEGSMDGVLLARRRQAPIPVAITSAVLRTEEGEIAGVVAVLRDMTREREVERMKSEFLSNISHELRTPLTPIRGYAELLATSDSVGGKAGEFASGILDSTTRLERIVALLIDFAELEAGRLEPRARPVDVAEMVRELARDWGPRAPRHEVVAEVEQSLPDVVGDERLLRRSLEEILDNAVKFSPDGGTIKVMAKADGARRRPAVSVTVSDEGIGISQDDLSRIFSEFQQLDGSETRQFGGLGLGLAFVQRIVEAHRGQVKVESAQDHGTTLTITIPAARGAS